jgi:cytochrome c oxidase subunit 2
MAVLTVSVIGLGAMAQAPAGAAAGAQAQEPAMREIELKATKYEFTPGKVEIPLNATVRFKVTAADRDHGFAIEGEKDKDGKDACNKIKKGDTLTVEYKATKAGTIKFKCCDYCGLGHGRMNGEIVVK